ncbi:MAG: hypothetical protein ACK4K2_05430 [Dehalococcoidia bacterium]
MTVEEHPQISIYLFPYLEEFVVADMRPQEPGRPTLLFIPWREVLDATFHREARKGFNALLEEGQDFPLANLLTLPARVEGVIREAGMRAILRRLGITLEGQELPRIGVFLVSGQALGRQGEALALAVEELVGHLAPPAFQREAALALERMLHKEHETLRRLEREHLQRSLLGKAPGFYTLWQKPRQED